MTTPRTVREALNAAHVARARLTEARKRALEAATAAAAAAATAPPAAITAATDQEGGGHAGGS
jgi:hypothetical protein